jgi:DSF synthase
MSSMQETGSTRARYGKPNSQYETEFDPASGTIWGYFNPLGTACFSLGMLKDIRNHDNALETNAGHVSFGGAMCKANYYVAASRTPRVFNLGGDLALFVLLIKSRDRDALAHYAKLCIDNIYPRVHGYGSPTLTTISLVQGDALGGGFECALSSDVIVAEESSQMGLPEILFNLFPGMGAYSLLARRVGMRTAENLILSGRMMSAAELHGLGIVDVLARDGDGENAVRDWIAKNGRRRSGFQAVYRARQQVSPVTRGELDRIADIWVDAALRLEDRDLKMMSRIVRSQMRRMAGEAVADVTAEALAASA